ncbi:MAG: flagellar filament capping protein FliD [Desulfurivibrio sp.]|nr:flagellar filament capping protein FliD [Desulfurivibrio sp.]
MAVGSLSALGLGSGLELQKIIDDLRAADEQQRIRPIKNNITKLENRLEAFNGVQNKLLDIRGYARDLNMESTYLKRDVSSSDESVFTATVSDGAEVGQTTVEVDQMASKSSWLSSGLADKSSIVYVPTSQESTSGVADPDASVVLAAGDSLTIEYGETDSFTVTAGADLTLNQLVTEINEHADNVGGGANGRMVTAETYTVGSDTHLRIKTDTTGGTGESHRVEVSDNASTLAFSPPDEVFQYEFGPADNTTAVSLAVAADTTLSGLVDKINSDTDNPGVTASIIDTGDSSNPYKLLLQADDTGEDNRLTITSEPPDIAFTEQEGAAGESLNAKLLIDGITYQRQDNTITDIFTGVTLNLQGAGTSTLDVSGRTEDVRDTVVQLVEDYNELVQEVAAQTSYDEESGQPGALARTSVQGLRHELEGVMTAMFEGDESGQVQSLFDLGMEFQRDGSITLDTTILDQRLAEDSEAVYAFLLGDEDREQQGFAENLHERLGSIASMGGLLESEKDSAESRIKDLEGRIESETMRLDRRYEAMTREFVELDSYMQKMQSMGDYLKGQFESLKGVTSE